MRSKVAIVKVDAGITESVRKAIDLMGGIRLRKNSHVVIKPNICYPKDYHRMVLTDLTVIETVLNVIKRFTQNVTIVESDAMAGTAEERAAKSGFLEAIDGWGVDFKNLSKAESRNHEADGVTLRIPEIVLNADYFVNLPKLKTCGYTLVSISMKNLFGILRNKKPSLHKPLNTILPYINKVVKQDLIIVDGITAMEGNGPVIGNPVNLNLIISGRNPVSVDSVCTYIMGFDPSDVEHIFNAHRMGVGDLDLKRVEIMGESLNRIRHAFARPYSADAIVKTMKTHGIPVYLEYLRYFSESLK